MKLRLQFRAWKARYRDQRREIRAALSLVQPGDTVVDVGANKGTYLYWMRKAVGENGKVYAFEPQPSLFRYLSQVTTVMNWKNVVVKDCALSETTGVRKLFVPGGGESPGATLENEGESNGSSYECQIDTLDRQLQDTARVTFLKVDVEGHELQVFRGARQVLTKHAPAILFECEARHLRHHTMQDVFAFLRGLGYEGGFFSSEALKPLAEFDPVIHQKQTGERFWDLPEYCNNFLFVHRSSKKPLRFE